MAFPLVSRDFSGALWTFIVLLTFCCSSSFWDGRSFCAGHSISLWSLTRVTFNIHLRSRISHLFKTIRSFSLSQWLFNELQITLSPSTQVCVLHIVENGKEDQGWSLFFWDAAAAAAESKCIRTKIETFQANNMLIIWASNGYLRNIEASYWNWEARDSRAVDITWANFGKLFLCWQFSCRPHSQVTAPNPCALSSLEPNLSKASGFWHDNSTHLPHTFLSVVH